MLYRISLLFVLEPCAKCGQIWDTAAIATNTLAAKFYWQTGGHENIQELAALAATLKDTASRVKCGNNHCTTKRNICIFIHGTLVGEFRFRCIPSWAFKVEWFGPNAVYFGETQQ